MSRVTCHMSHVIRHISHVKYHNLFFVENGGASHRRICYQRGLPRQVSVILQCVHGEPPRQQHLVC